MNPAKKTLAESHTAQWLEAALRSAALTSRHTGGVGPQDDPTAHNRQQAEVEAILAAFRPACVHVATSIPSAYSRWSGLHRHHERGVFIDERAPSGDDGGAYLYLLADGGLAELAQWPIRMGDAEGWVGRLVPISVRGALSAYPGLCPRRLSRTLTEAFGGWLTRRAAE